MGSKARFKIDEAASGEGNSANIKFVAVGPTVGFQLREWGNITYRLRILVADGTIHDEDLQGRVLKRMRQQLRYLYL